MHCSALRGSTVRQCSERANASPMRPAQAELLFPSGDLQACRGIGASCFLREGPPWACCRNGPQTGGDSGLTRVGSVDRRQTGRCNVGEMLCKNGIIFFVCAKLLICGFSCDRPFCGFLCILFSFQVVVVVVVVSGGRSKLAPHPIPTGTHLNIGR